MGAAFDDHLVHDVAEIIGQEGRAFANYDVAGFNYWTPNVNVSIVSPEGI
jgi:beta-D-xylosidase 4